jgi:uncharacterized protein YjbI with pentapeptide repeats
MLAWLENLIFPGNPSKQHPIEIKDSEGKVQLIITQKTLDYTDFSNIIFSRMKIFEKEMRNCFFKNIEGIEVIFKDCDLSRSTFKGATLVGSSFINCNLSQSNFRNANLAKSSFKNCNLEKADFINTLLDGVKIESCNLEGVRQ